MKHDVKTKGASKQMKKALDHKKPAAKKSSLVNGYNMKPKKAPKK